VCHGSRFVPSVRALDAPDTLKDRKLREVLGVGGFSTTKFPAIIMNKTTLSTTMPTQQARIDPKKASFQEKHRFAITYRLRTSARVDWSWPDAPRVYMCERETERGGQNTRINILKDRTRKSLHLIAQCSSLRCHGATRIVAVRISKTRESRNAALRATRRTLSDETGVEK
jgi:hypothetical protein